ncbi:tubulin-like doman-containing protein [Candidatus Synechococcus spongiarum]|uniref:tubulin-like doman-containing protein n=1 Tax=Candidatus Synechococcus spongiarum TaxID=431041 RepID=UPI001F2A1C34|nr:tubulin-like doman-containing protein [Candidatus Synechococcus spongiarum]
MGLLDQEESPPTELGVLFVEPDRQSALLQRAQTALVRTQSLHKALGGVTQHFCPGGELKDYGVWNPVESVAGQGSLTMAQIYTKHTLQHRSPALGGLMDCLFTQEEQKLDLREGFRGRPPIGSALMSAIALDDSIHAKTWGRFLGDVRQAAKGGEEVCIHMFGSVFGGTGASGVPTVGQLLRNWLKNEGIQRAQLNASLLLPYFNFKDHGTKDTGLHAEASNFQLNTGAALQYLSQEDNQDFDRVYLLGSDAKVAYGFSIGGASQANGAHLVELLAALGLRDSLGKTRQAAEAAYTLSRHNQSSVNWSDLPDSAITRRAMSRGARLAVVWRNNISLDLEAANGQSLKRFCVGAPWATRFYPAGSSEEASTLGSRKDKDARLAADQWSETLLTWLKQLCSSTGGALEQKLLNPAKLQVQQMHLESLADLVRDRDDGQVPKRETDVEYLKIKLDRRTSGGNPKGTAGLLDTLWELCDQP